MRANTNITLSSIVEPSNEEELKSLFRDEDRLLANRKVLEQIVRELFSDAEEVTVTFTLQEDSQ